MNKRQTKNICLFCFGDLDSSRICLNCKRPADETPSKIHHLPQRTVLKNRYLLYKPIGEGGFGITYVAWDMHLQTKVAIKEYFPSVYVARAPKSNQVIIKSKDKRESANRGLKRFIEEAKMLSMVKNLPGIVSVLDFFPENGTAYIVMEFLDGISLKKYIYRKGGKVSADEILGILNPVMTSLIKVHETGLIHRDISPDNIILTKYNEVKLIDFGAAKQEELDEKHLSIVLKPAYAPEEQYRSASAEQGAWTDIYALGVTIYYCITGTLPPESVERINTDSIERPSKLKAVISKTQEAALMKALEVNYKNRYQSVKEMMAGFYGVSPTQALEFANASMGAATVSDTVSERTRTIFRAKTAPDTSSQNPAVSGSLSKTVEPTGALHNYEPVKNTKRSETEEERKEKENILARLKALKDKKKK